MTDGNDELDALFVRYWDDALTPAEHDRLAELLAADPVAREQFRLLCLQVVALADLPAVNPTGADRPARPVVGREWSRRGLARLVGGSVAVGLLAAALGRYLRDRGEGLTLASIRGTVTVHTAGRRHPTDQPVPLGATVAAHGLGSSAVLRMPDGADITLLSDSAVRVADARRLAVLRGAIGAGVPPQPASARPLTLEAACVSLTGVSGAALSLGEVTPASEVAVYHGSVTAARPSGEPMGVVRQGELLVAQPDGAHRKQPMPPTPTEFALDLARPLPAGWEVGTRAAAPGGFVLRPEWWPDPYHGYTVMSQIRSDARWACGFVSLTADSVLRLRYRVARPGRGQMCLCVRGAGTVSSPTGVLDTGDGAFARARPGEWQWLTVRAGDMLGQAEAPRFRDPWVAFLIIFNTFAEDLGLEVAELHAAPRRG